MDPKSTTVGAAQPTTTPETPASPLLQNPKSSTPKNPFLQATEANDALPKAADDVDDRGDGQRQADESLGEAKLPESFRALFFQYWQEAISYCAVFWTFGMCVAFLGPTLLDIGCMISSGIQTTTWAFTSQLFFSLMGAALSGYVVERFDANCVLLINTIIVPITFALLPLSRNIWSLTAILAVMGVNMGFIDCIANLQMFKVFGDSVAPFLHALHFCYGTGAFVSPMISEPYLLNEDCTPFVEPVTDEPYLVIDEETGIAKYLNTSDFPAKTLSEAQEMTQIKYVFWIMAGVQTPVAILVFLLAYKMRSRGWTPAHQEINQADVVDPKRVEQVEKKMKKLEESNLKASQRKPFFSEKNQIIFITGSTAALLFIYDGLQSSYGGFIYSYAVKSIADLNKTEAAYLNALFWGMFALGRLISIYLATKFTPAFMLLCNMMGCMVSINMMLVMRHDHIVLYIGTGVYGLFLSSIAPSSISMAEQYIDINSKITSFLVVVAASGEMAFPLVVGHLFAGLGPTSFLVFCSLMGFLSVAVYGALWIVGRTTPKHFGRYSTDKLRYGRTGQYVSDVKEGVFSNLSRFSQKCFCYKTSKSSQSSE